MELKDARKKVYAYRILADSALRYNDEEIRKAVIVASHDFLEDLALDVYQNAKLISRMDRNEEYIKLRNENIMMDNELDELIEALSKLDSNIASNIRRW